MITLSYVDETQSETKAMTQHPIPPLAQTAQSATEQVFQSLYRAVIALQLPPGTKMSEADVAKQLDVSRQPVRDAFFRLSALGFLSIRPQRATLITRISEAAVRDAVFTRTALEVECLRVIMANPQPDAIAKLEACQTQLTANLTAEDRGAFHQADEDFHAMICQLAGHAHVWTLIREKKAHMDRIRYLTLSEERRQLVADEHGVLIRAISAGNAAGAETHLRTHLSGVLSTMPGVRARFPDYFEAQTSEARP
jgi:DNA-binding GntR family transcriptional regulator